MSLILICSLAQAAVGSKDTVILKFKNNVNILVISDGEESMESALSYDLNEILKDLKYKMRMNDDQTLTLVVEDEYGSRYLKDTMIVVDSGLEKDRETRWSDDEEDENDDYDYEQRQKERERSYRKRTRNYYNIDIGMNNYLEDGGFPDQSNALYTVRPWGSWYVGVFSLFKTNIAGPLNLEWGGGIDWYSFKFENARTRISKTDAGLDFTEDMSTSINPQMSKLSAAYISARFIPVFDFSRSGRRDRDRLWNSNIGSGLRFGIGPYAAYRIDSWTKTRYTEEGDKQKPREKSNYYLNNFRYGARAQVGWKGVDIFVNYDMNELFTDSKDTPNLNAFSFGFTL